MDASSAQRRPSVEYQPAWLTWVASVTSCLKALGVDCDITDVAGYSGYAFCMSVHEELCPSGPTVIDWNMLSAGVHSLGRTTVEFMGFSSHPIDKEDPLYQANARAMYDFVSREIEAGRPCVIWGTYVPEFGVAVGTEDDCYHVQCFKGSMGEEQPPIPLLDLDLVHIHYALAFPAEASGFRRWADRQAVYRARRLLTQPSEHAQYGWAAAAYQTWIDALEADKADKFGGAYNAQCWHEAKRCAAKFLERLAGRNEAVRPQLEQAAKHFDSTTEAMAGVAKLFPFPPGEEPPGAETRTQAVQLLKSAAATEEQAVAALDDACGADWPVE